MAHSPYHHIVKTTDESRLNTTTYTPDAQLRINNIPAGTYRLFMQLYHQGHATPDIKARLVFSGEATFILASDLDNTAAGIVNLGTIATAGATTKRLGTWMGMLVVTTEGNLVLQWAQNTLDAVNKVDILAPSFISLLRLI